MAPIKLGIIGYGFSAKCFHLPFILGNPDLQVYAFLQRAAAPDEVSEVKGWGHCIIDYPDAKHYRTADEFFADHEIELVIVCTHNHEEFVERALTAGKHVVVEKPFTNTSAAAEKLIALAKEKGKVLTVFQNRRWDSDFRTLRHLYEEGAFGRVTEAEIHYDIPSPGWIAGWGKDYSPGQGMMFGLGSHTIDQALVLFGRPSSVIAFLRSNRGMESDIDDTFTIILQYSGEQKSLLVTIKTTVVTHMKDQLKYFVRGTKGTFVKYGDDPQERKTMAAPGQAFSTEEAAGMEDESTWGTLTTTTQFDSKSQQYDNSCEKYVGRFPSIPGYYRGYYQNVVASIRGEGKSLLLEDGDVRGAITADGVEHRADRTILAMGANAPQLLDFENQLRPTAWTLAHIPMTEEETRLYKNLPVLFNIEKGFFMEPDEDKHELKLCDEHPGYCNWVDQPGSALPQSVPVAKHEVPASAERRMRDFLREIMPHLADRPFTFARMCWCADTRNRAFLITYHPKHPSLVVASGDSGHGFMHIPSIGGFIVDCMENKLQPNFAKSWRWRPETTRDFWGRDVLDRFGAGNKMLDVNETREEGWTNVNATPLTVA